MAMDGESGLRVLFFPSHRVNPDKLIAQHGEDFMADGRIASLLAANGRLASEVFKQMVEIQKVMAQSQKAMVEMHKAKEAKHTEELKAQAVKHIQEMEAQTANYLEKRKRIDAEWIDIAV
ncbi:uncharacterized protein DSM5745_05105 [Aspergillus mulundensis]|uniref:Uncharacterized protein n=1 Tax=Aspergillus mulundensis TaxID=1810919 RepID=A0A3D8S5J2_9EURO|nr:hypothetical protein DSM5745_05105 [Aspergillus mulundensis]RDW81548.1 hypothetical protein DSM5745_05105 [Aspergillus mulundensis]